jgi:hypothetical protein
MSAAAHEHPLPGNSHPVAPIDDLMASMNSLPLSSALLPCPRIQPECPDPPASDNSPLALNDCSQRDALPPQWLRALPLNLRRQVQRLPVVGDGSCADGAIVQAIEQSDFLDSLPLSQSLLHSRVHSKDTFRQHEVGSAVAMWTVDDWVSKMPASFRDEEWQEKRRIDAAMLDNGSMGDPEAPCRTATRELEFFRHVLTLPTHAVGNAYLHAAAGVLQQGILLLTTDRRCHRAVHQLDDFGTQQYPSSIILFFSVGPLKPGSRGDGHYETVCLSAPDEHSVHTVFERSHPVLCSLRVWAARHSDEHTMERDRMRWFCHPAISARSGEQFGGPPPPDGSSARSALPPDEHTGIRPRRQRVIPARLRESQDDQDRHGATISRRPAAARSLLTALNTAAVSQPIDSPIDSETRHPHRHGAPPRVRADGGPDGGSPVVAAAPRAQSSDRPTTLGESAKRNLLAWVRQRSRRGRLASRVHLSAVPMWTTRCRTVLQGLACALQESPMNEDKVVTWLCVLWMLPQEVFTVPGRGRGGKTGRKLRHNRIHHILNDATLLSRLAARAETRPDGAVESQDSDGAAAAVHTQRAGVVMPDLQHLSPGVTGTEQREVGTGERAGVRVDVAVPPVDDHGAAGTWPPVRPKDRDVARRVEHFFRLGHTQRAMRALVSTMGKADLDQATERAALRALHPLGPSELPACPADAPELVVDPSWMADEMQRSDTGAAPGPSGYGSNFIQVLATDAACVAALAVLIGHIVNDKLPATVRNLLNTCVLVSLEKNGGGRRPVAMGDMFYRMAARFALSLVLDSAQRTLRPYQFAVGAEDGCTQVVQSLQHLLSLSPAPAPPNPRPPHQFAFSRPRPAPMPADPTPRPLACLSIDIVNAFNTVNRAAVLRAVYDNADLALCWRMVAFGYGHPGQLLMPCGDEVDEMDAFIESSNGVRQGDPLAALLFALVMHGVYQHVARICHSGCFAYSDDGHGVGWLEECWRAWEALPEQLGPLGLRVNAAKCELTCFHSDTLQHAADVTALEAFRAAGVSINTSALKVLGCVVGSTNTVTAQELAQRPGFRADQQGAFQRIPLLSKTAGYLALTQLTGVVVTNRLRAMSPAATKAHAAEYDRQVLRAAHTLVGIREIDGDRYDEQLQAPARLGGLGLVSATSIAPAAYLAGAECTLRSSPVFSTVWSGTDELEPAWPITVAIEDSLRCIAEVEASIVARCDQEAVAGVSASVLPASAAAFVAHFKAQPPVPVQSAIIHRITILSHIATMKAAGEGGVRAKAEVARLQALKEKESSRWLRVLPTDAGLRLTDLQWQTAAQLRLGMPKAPYGDAAPPCDHVRAAANDGWHALVCLQRSGTAINARHNAVVHLLADAAALLKVPARVEPYNLCEDDDHRPDIQLDLPEYTLLADVTVSHPCAQCWRTVAADRGVEAVGDARSVEKDNTYTSMAETLGVQFSPFVLYTFGGMHTSALSIINKLGEAHDPAVALVSLTAWKEELKNRIAVCVQRHTANIMIDDARRARVGRMARCRRRTRRWRPRSTVLLSRQRLQERGLWEVGARAVSLCASLLAPSSDASRMRLPVASALAGCDQQEGSDDDTVVLSSPSASLVPGLVEEVFVPGTPGMDDVPSGVDVCERAVSGVSVSESRVCDGVRVEGMEVEAALEEELDTTRG